MNTRKLTASRLYGALVVLGASATLFACSDDAENPITPATDAGTDSAKPQTDAGGGNDDAGNDSGSTSPAAHVRVAHLSPDAPAVDFCVAPHGTTNFIGPVLAGAGAAAGLKFGDVTKYLDVPPAQYDVRIVAPASTDCTKSLAGLPDITNLPELSDGAYATLAAEGELAATATNKFGITPYIDDSTVDAGKAKLRFVHASPDTPAVDVGLGGGVLFTSVFTNVAFGAVSKDVGPNGYLTTPPIAGAEISARAHGQLTDVLSIKPAALPAGAIATAFAYGKLADKSLKVLLCVDNAAAKGLLSDCTPVGAAPERAHVRVAHLSPDAPAVDVCIKPHPPAAFPAKPLLASLGAAAGLSFKNVTTYVDLPVSSYDIRLVAAPATDCTMKAFEADDVAVTNGLYADIAAIGDFTKAGTDPAFTLKPFVNETTTTAGKAKLRFVHASPGTPAVDVGLGSGASFTKVFAGVSFGNVAAAGGGISANGYVETAPIANGTVSARLKDTPADALTITGVNLPASAIATAYAIGGKTGDAANPLKVLLCVDSAPAKGLLADCSVVP